jgi:3-mercaptopyruvate sulfurtransferase SseA
MAENRRKIFPWIIIGGGLLLLLAGMLAVFSNQPNKVEETPTPASASQVQRVSLTDAKAAFDAGRAVFLDVRDSASYNAGHIPGAVSIPINDLPNRMDELNPKSWIIPYCT